MVVVGGLGDASACRDVGPFLFVEKAFDNDLALRVRQVVKMPLQDVTELLDVVLFAPRRGRWRVVLALVVPREDRVELAVGEVAATNVWLRIDAYTPPSSSGCDR
jgi:hypothetical protein